jgi:hypothetical protein
MAEVAIPRQMFQEILRLIGELRAAAAPRASMRRLCRGIASHDTDPLAGGEPTVTFDRCMSAEQADRQKYTPVRGSSGESRLKAGYKFSITRFSAHFGLCDAMLLNRPPKMSIILS